MDRNDDGEVVSSIDICDLERDEVVFYHWIYDDGSVGCIAIDEEKECCLFANTFSDMVSYREFRRQRKKKIKKQNRDFAKQRLTFRCGLRAMKYGNPIFRGILEKGMTVSFQNIISMLESCGKDTKSMGEILRIVGSILAGYLVRLVCECDCTQVPIWKQRAPALQVPYADFSWYLLHEIAMSMIIDTSSDGQEEKEAHIVSRNPAVFPENLNAMHIDQCAFTVWEDKAGFYEERFPAQYRDTAVLINGDFVTTKQMQEFVHRNRWCTIILFGGRLQDPVHINSKILSHGDLTWDCAKVHKLVDAFVIYLANSEAKELTTRIRKALISKEHLIMQYNMQKGVEKIRRPDIFWNKLQLIALDFFLDFAKNHRQIAQDVSDRLSAQWSNLLLPGCCSTPHDSRPIEDREQITKTDYTDIFYNVLQKMLQPENLDRFLPVRPGDFFDLQDPSATPFSYWGYVRQYNNKKSRTKFPALQFREDVFLKVGEDFLSIKCNLHNVLKFVRENPPAFLHPTPKARMPENGLDKSLCSAIVIDLSKLDVVEPPVLERILGIIPEQTTP